MSFTSSRYLTNQFGLCLTESPVKVLVGQDSKAYYVHPSILSSSKSSSTSVHLNGAWRSAGDGTVDWKDFDEETIKCVLHYLYTGDYHIPKPAEEDAESSKELVGFALRTYHAEEPLDLDEMVRTGQAPKRIARPLTPLNKCLPAGLPVQRLQTAAGLVAREESEPRNLDTLGPSILLHAKVYSFAQCHFYSDLAVLALQRLTQVLLMEPSQRIALFPYVADAIRHIYSTTMRREDDDPARTLLSQYVALHHTHLTGKDLNALSEEGGEFMADVMNKIARHTAESSNHVDKMKSEVETLKTRVKFMQDQYKEQDDEIIRYRKELLHWEIWDQGHPLHEKKRRFQPDGSSMGSFDR